jgi:Mn-dependent DtxR family transcriptional regulator
MTNICPDFPDMIKSSSSLEDYLEAIFLLSGSAGTPVRITDISERIGVTKASASIAVKKLAHAGALVHERYGSIRLTSSGKMCAKRVASRHDLLFRFLKDVLGVDSDIADKDACRLEHDLSPESVECLTRFVEFLTGGSMAGNTWSRNFDKHLANGKHHEDLVQGR